MSKHVFLIGYMGSGKTHWGRITAEALSRPFIDLDAMIESATGKSIAEIFAQSGENGFRLLEKQHLRLLQSYDASIVATGGGTPCFFDNMDWMQKNGRVIYLKTAPEILFERLKAEPEKRPLLKQFDETGLSEFIKDRLEARAPVYETADQIIEYTGDNEAFFHRLLDLIRGLI